MNEDNNNSQITYKDVDNKLGLIAIREYSAQTNGNFLSFM